jgi:SAM-dependent methyltransferase
MEHKSTEYIFQQIYLNNVWRCDETRSGPGSTLSSTTLLRQNLVEVLTKLNVKTIVDAPCGDINWMQHLDYEFDQYIGIDIVPELIEKLRDTNIIKNSSFQVNNIITDILPQADVIFCRDCLIHLPFDKIKKAITNISKAGFKYIITTTFPRQINIDCTTGSWRPLNFGADPFNWPAPNYLINEQPENSNWQFADKSMGVWDIKKLTDYNKE